MSQYDSPISTEPGDDLYAADDARVAPSRSATSSPSMTTVTTSLPSQSDSTGAVASEQAKQVGQEAVDGGKQVAAVTTDQAKSVAAEAGTQARNLLDEARSQLTEQASAQQSNLASWLQSLVEELDQMVNRSGDTEAATGPATSLVKHAADQARNAAGWLERHEPADLLSETARFARQRPGLFLALAAAGGLLAGRLTRGLTADSTTTPSGAVVAADRSGSRASSSTLTPALAASAAADDATTLGGDSGRELPAPGHIGISAGEDAYDDRLGSPVEFVGAGEAEADREVR